MASNSRNSRTDAEPKPRETLGSLESDCCVVSPRASFRQDLLPGFEPELGKRRSFENAAEICYRVKDGLFDEELFDSGVALSCPRTEDKRLSGGSTGSSSADFALNNKTLMRDDLQDDIREILNLSRLQISGSSVQEQEQEARSEEYCSAEDFSGCLLNWDVVFEQDEDGDTQLHIALMLDTQLDFALTVINLCPDPAFLNLQNDYQQMPLHLAVIMRRTQAVHALTSRGVKQFVCDHNGNTPLHIACQIGYTEAIHALTDCFVQTQQKPLLLQIIHHRNYEGLTCCHLAASSSVMDNLFYLTQDCGADLNVEEGKRGKTVLHVAAESNNLTLVTFLVSCPNVDLDQLTYDGWTAHDLAVGRRLREMEALLAAAGALRIEGGRQGPSCDSRRDEDTLYIPECPDLYLFKCNSLDDTDAGNRFNIALDNRI